MIALRAAIILAVVAVAAANVVQVPSTTVFHGAAPTIIQSTVPISTAAIVPQFYTSGVVNQLHPATFFPQFHSAAFAPQFNTVLKTHQVAPAAFIPGQVPHYVVPQLYTAQSTDGTHNFNVAGVPALTTQFHASPLPVVGGSFNFFDINGKLQRSKRSADLIPTGDKEEIGQTFFHNPKTVSLTSVVAATPIMYSGLTNTKVSSPVVFTSAHTGIVNPLIYTSQINPITFKSHYNPFVYSTLQHTGSITPVTYTSNKQTGLVKPLTVVSSNAAIPLTMTSFNTPLTYSGFTNTVVNNPTLVHNTVPAVASFAPLIHRMFPQLNNAVTYNFSH